MGDQRVIEVWNKADLLTEEEIKHFTYIRRKQGIDVHLISALYGDGFEDLLEALEARLNDLASLHVPGTTSDGAIEVASRGHQRLRIPDTMPVKEVGEVWSFLYNN